MTLDAIKQALSKVNYPGFSRDIVSFGLVRSVDFSDGKATVSIAVTTSDHKIPARIRDDVEAALKALEGVQDVEVNVTLAAAKKTAAQGGAPEPTHLPQVKHIIAVASGKGGVGKSTFSANLACAFAQILAKQGKKVGLLDCDIYGPTIPLMLGVSRRPEIEGDSLIPLERHGLKIMSMGFLIEDDTPVVWRGPMIMKTIKQFIHNVKWGELETLIIDLPPGTGDAQLSLVQTVPLRGAIIVTTPQQASTQVAKRGAKMLEKTNVPLVGVAENMSYLESENGERTYIFGQGGGERSARELNTAFLGQVPLDPAIRESGDAGRPIVVERPESKSAAAFLSIAQEVIDRLG